MGEGNYIVQISSLCNLNCCFCAIPIEGRSKPDFQFKKLIQGLKENRRKFDQLIITSDGEPTIYRHILKYIYYAKYVCKYERVFLTTNAVMLHNQDNVDKLVKSGVDAFQVSFSTSDERMFDAIVKMKGAFKHASQGIVNIKKTNKIVRINSVLHKLNYKNIANTVRYLIGLGVDAIQLAFLDPIGSSIVNGKSAIAITYSELMPYMRDALKVADEMGFKEIYLENFPICIAPEFISKLSDLRKPEANKDYYNANKTKPEKCKRCSFVDRCDGVWEPYLKQFGDDELRPISIAESIQIRQIRI